MSPVWLTILAVAALSASIKAAGPVLVGNRPLPGQTNAVIALLASALLTALVVTQTFGQDGAFAVDERAAGVAITVIALLLRAHILAAVAVGALATALLRLVA